MEEHHRKRSLLAAAVVACSVMSVIGIDPAFDVPIVNVTVVRGQTAVLPCSIDNLQKFKVAWLDAQSIPLTYEDRRVVDDTRFSVIRPYVREWNLQVRDIKSEDEGQYRCTINTNPVKSKVVILHVKVPAEINDDLSSGDVTVQEGDTVRLHCNVTGVPLPQVTWTRKSTSVRMLGARHSHTCKHRTAEGGSGVMGAVLIIQNISRYCDDHYECEASNGVPPSVSKLIKVTVEFPPAIEMPNRRIGQVLGKETILECRITAFPHAVNYWEKDTKRIISSQRHRIDAYEEGDHTLTLSLRIADIDAGDIGEYKCVASNSLGKDVGSMILYAADFRPPATEPLLLLNPPPTDYPTTIPVSIVRYSKPNAAAVAGPTHRIVTQTGNRSGKNTQLPSTGRMTGACERLSSGSWLSMTSLSVMTSLCVARAVVCGDVNGHRWLR